MAFPAARISTATTTEWNVSEIAGPRVLEFSKSSNSFQDVEFAIESCIAWYKTRSPDSNALKWLRQLSEKAVYYQDVVDVIIQQHPEVVSLIWGSMRFLFLGAMNHEKTIKGLAKALTEIADALPRVEIRSHLFPTDRMKGAVSKICVDILRFLTRVYKWYYESGLKRTLHSFTQTFDLRYADILEDIRYGSYVVQDLAACGQMVELRHLNYKIDQTGDTLAIKFTRIDSTLNMLIAKINNLNTRSVAAEASSIQRLHEIPTKTSLISSTTLDTNRQLSEFQFSQIMQSVTDEKMWEPQKTLNYLLVNQTRSSQKQARQLSEGFWELARMRSWARSKESDISVVKGDFRSRHALRCFSVGVIEQLRLKQIPVVFALGTSQEGAAAKSLSNGDLMKYLVRQALDWRRCGQTERSMSHNAAAFAGNLSEQEWFSLLKHLLSGLSGSVYFVVDLELLNRSFISHSSFDWLSAFLGLFKSVAERGDQLTIKVLLVSYSPELPFETSRDEHSGFIVPAKKTKLMAQKRKGMATGARGRGRQTRYRAGAGDSHMTPDPSTSTVASSANKCLMSFQECISRASSVDALELSMVEDQVARFSTWTTALGVFASQRSSMDHRLRSAPDVRNVVNGLLESLNYRNTICSSIFQTMGRDSPTDHSQVRWQLRQSYTHIGTEISRLNKISNTIRRASKESQFLKANDFQITDDEGNDAESLLFSVFEHHVSDRFPNISETIQQRVVRAMIVRRKRIMYRRHRQGVVAIRPQETPPKTAITLPGVPQTIHMPNDVARHDTDKDAAISTSKSTPSMVQSATTLDPAKFKKASASPSTVSASKTISLGDHERVTCPPSPGLAAKRKYEQLRRQRDIEYKKEVKRNGVTEDLVLRFENLKDSDLKMIGEVTCPYCLYALPAEVVLIESKWKNHVKNDLDPYVCLFEDCDQPDVLFGHSEEWRDHMSQHYRFWRCHSHRDLGSFSSAGDYMKHIRESHQTTLSDIQLRALANRNSRTTSKMFPMCPLCGENEPNGQTDSHITGHLRSLALKSLPICEEEIPEDARSNDNSDPASSQHSRSTTKNLIDLKETPGIEEGSDLVEQANQSNAKNFLGDAHIDLEQGEGEFRDAALFDIFVQKGLPWDPEDDKTFQSFMLEKRKQEQSERHGVK